jgi:hypothetical protein
MHLIFFICMNFLDPSEHTGDHAYHPSSVPWTVSLKESGGERLLRMLEGSEESEAKEHLEPKTEEDWHQLNAHHADIYQILKYCHLLTFICQMLYIFLKKRGYKNTAQIVEMVIVGGYVLTTTAVMYTVKATYHYWYRNEMILARVWFVVEVNYFFSWLYSIVIFLQIAYWTKLSPIHPKDSSVNLWNAKKSTDFLKYMKLEGFYACYMLSYAIQAINIGFFTGKEGDFTGRALLGRVDFYPCQVTFLLFLLARTIDFGVSLSYIYRKDDQGSQKASPLRQLFNHVIKAVTLAAVLSIFYTHFTAEDRLNADGSTHSYYSFI